jgi:hypothetical protein
MYNHRHIQEGLRILQRRINVAYDGVKQHSGTPEEICAQIVKNCWNNVFFQVSNGHFNVFYMRDFGMCVEALLKLGYRKEVLKTLQYALVVYSRDKKVSTTISQDHTGFDVFSYAPDTLAFLLYSLQLAKADDLLDVYRPFLKQEVQRYYDAVVDPGTGLVRRDKDFSSIKDNAKRKSCCYDNVCAAVVAREAKKLKLLDKGHPFLKVNYKKLIKETFWFGGFFKDTVESHYISGDANVFPFWFGLFTEKTMVKKSIAAIQRAKLDVPLPLKYTNFVPHNFIFPLSLLASNYEGTSVWAHLGLCYIDVVAKVDKKLAQHYVEQYRKRIEVHKNFLEIYNPDGTVYKTLFYHSDEGMLWAAKWLALQLSQKE